MNEPSSYSVNSTVSSRKESCSSPAVVVVTAYNVGNGFSRRSIIVIYARNICLRHTSVDPWNRFVSLCFALLGSCCRLSKTVGDSLSDNKMKIPIAEQASEQLHFYYDTTSCQPVQIQLSKKIEFQNNKAVNVAPVVVCHIVYNSQVQQLCFYNLHPMNNTNCS